MYRYDIIIFINIWKAKMNQMEEMIYRIKRMELYYDTIFNAVHNAVVLEEVANMNFNTLLINPDVARISQNLLDKHYLRKHGANAYYGQN